jgi:hypothetical protein
MDAATVLWTRIRLRFVCASLVLVNCDEAPQARCAHMEQQQFVSMVFFMCLPYVSINIKFKHILLKICS